MGSFNRDGRRQGGFGRGGFGGGRSSGRGGFGGRGGDRPAMHHAVCDECGNDCEVPFKPTGSRPVLCSNCFGKNQDSAPRRNSFGGDRRDRVSFEDREMFDAVCDKCGDDCKVPFKPTSGKELLCDNCFGKGGRKERGSRDTGSNSKELLEKIDELNAKVDKLMALLGDKAVEKTEKPKAEKKVAKVSKETKTTTAKKVAKKTTTTKAKAEKKVAKTTKTVAKKTTAKKTATKKKAPAKKK